mmetsp:Transcript_30832/g.56465  ORF Transcript_30832/g.56465 Transcript_30832/m.56465 type:complete len:104 (+) Transcript_30832:2537-2848(+)
MDKFSSHRYATPVAHTLISRGRIVWQLAALMRFASKRAALLDWVPFAFITLTIGFPLPFGPSADFAAQIADDKRRRKHDMISATTHYSFDVLIPSHDTDLVSA